MHNLARITFIVPTEFVKVCDFILAASSKLVNLINFSQCDFELV